jgi:uncharacterized protein (DUF58 family)
LSPVTLRPLGDLVGRVRGRAEAVRREVVGAIQPRRWVPGGHASQTLLDEEFLRRLERLQLYAQRSVKAGLIGEHKSVRKASSFEFADYRHYVPGDDFRRIDWNAYGRLEQLYLKLTEAKEDVGVHLLLDNSLSMNWGEPRKLQYGKQVLAALGYIALSRFDRIVAASFSDRLHEYFPATRGKQMALSYLDFLNSVGPGGQTDLRRAMADYCARVQQRGVAVVVSDLLAAEGVREGLELLVQRGLETTVVHLLDWREIKPEIAGDVELYDVETGERIELTVGPESIRSYEQRLAEWFAEMEAFCAKRGLNYLRIDTSWPFEGMVIQYFRQRRLLR